VDYVLPRTQFKQRDFCKSAPAVWNSPLSELHDISDANTFKHDAQLSQRDLAQRTVG